MSAYFEGSVMPFADAPLNVPYRLYRHDFCNCVWERTNATSHRLVEGLCERWRAHASPCNNERGDRYTVQLLVDPLAHALDQRFNQTGEHSEHSNV